MSAITLKKKKRMLFLPVEFNNVKKHALVGSGVYIDAISEKDVERIKHNADHCFVKKAPPPPLNTVRQCKTRTTPCNVHDAISNRRLHL